MRLARRRRWLVMLGLALLPVALVSLYMVLLAAPRYSAEARFSVRASSPATNGATGGQAGIISTGGSPVAGFVDGWAVSDFLNSRDCMRELDAKVDLRKLFSRSGLDPVYRLPGNASEAALYRAYQTSIAVNYNMIEQVDVLKVSAFSPGDAALISNTLIGLAQDFVNRMDERGIADALKVSLRSLALAEQQDLDALSAMARWRAAHGDIDPGAEASMLLTMVGRLETQLSAAQVNLDKVQALNNPDHPMLRPAQIEVASLQQRLAATRRRLSGSGDTEASQLKSYEALKNSQTFADTNLAATRQTYQQAFTDTLRLQRYLSLIARPVPDDEPSSPNVILLLLEAIAVGLVLAFLGSMGAGLYRGHAQR